MRIKMRTLLAIVLGIVFVDAAFLYAAEEPPAEAAQADISDDQTAEEMLAAEAALEAQEAAAASEPGESSTADPVEPDTAEAGERSPGINDEDFVPTIQISEDLSVSFPVDI